ncbi:DegT/DnrJ/EryC1/StrS family aminotransferase [Pontibacillus marinus]
MVDLKSELELMKEPILNAIKEVVESTSYILGDKGATLEKQIAEYVDAKYGIGVANGTDALLLSLKALGIGAGDEVITTPFTFFASGEVIANVDATPVFVDIDPNTYNIDPQEVKKAVTPKTKAIMIVHIFGQTAKMDSLLEIAKENNLKVIEDACQAIGTEYKGKRIGSIGDIGCFSFFPSKNLGAFGDAGMIVTNSKELYDKVIELRNHGSNIKYNHTTLGFNSRLDEIQAAILLEKLKYLDIFLEARKKIATNYSRELSDIVKTPPIYTTREHTFHQYSIETPYRNELSNYLQQKQISTAIYYPTPLHLQEAFKYLNYQNGKFPVAEFSSENILALPIGPTLTEDHQGYIISCIRDFFDIKINSTSE